MQYFIVLYNVCPWVSIYMIFQTQPLGKQVNLIAIRLRILLLLKKKRKAFAVSFNKKNRDTVPGPVIRAEGSMGYWQRQPPPTYLLFVPFWVLNKHHDVTLPGADGVHGELGWLLHHVPSGLDTCSQVYTGTLQTGSGPNSASFREMRPGTIPASAMWEMVTNCDGDNHVKNSQIWGCPSWSSD